MSVFPRGTTWRTQEGRWIFLPSHSQEVEAFFFPAVTPCLLAVTAFPLSLQDTTVTSSTQIPQPHKHTTLGHWWCCKENDGKRKAPHVGWGNSKGKKMSSSHIHVAARRRYTYLTSGLGFSQLSSLGCLGLYIFCSSNTANPAWLTSSIKYTQLKASL